MKYKYDIIQIAGFVVMVLGAQSGIRQIIHPADNALVAWVPGGAGTQIAFSIVAAAAGATLTGWAFAKARRFDRRGDDVQAEKREHNNDWRL